jgi:hypothetical protein
MGKDATHTQFGSLRSGADRRQEPSARSQEVGSRGQRAEGRRQESADIRRAGYDVDRVQIEREELSACPTLPVIS